MSFLSRNIPRLEPGLAMYYTILLILLTPILVLVALERENRRTQRSEPKGCRKLGLRIRSNLADQYDPKYLKGGPAGQEKDGSQRWKVKSLTIYPIKSCRGIELNKGEVISTGMKYDRLFTFAQMKSPFPVKESTPTAEKAAHKWEFITQREYPLLAKVSTEIWIPDPTSPTYSSTAPEVLSGGMVIMTFPYDEDGIKGWLDTARAWIRRSKPEKSFTIPLDPTAEQSKGKKYEVEELFVWRKPAKGLNMSIEIPPELKYYLGVTHPLALFRVDPANHRQVFRCAPKKEDLGYQPVVGFADAYPLHILNLASVRDFNKHTYSVLPKLDIIRFRPNIIITGPEPHAEDSWKKIRIGQDEYHVSCRTTRCKLPNVNQDTGIKHNAEPDEALRKHRRVDKGDPYKACMGMQMVPAVEKGTIKVGDVVEVLEIGEHLYIKQ
ncbi:MAG: hypothetical protein M1812_006303 [Candelaria pacifica]|nr:MAG: hypothetical protein M1812_006303 [Candelaria pacifica]